MTKKDVNTFIEEMEAIGDEWTPEQVEYVYGDSSFCYYLAHNRLPGDVLT